MAQRCTGLWPLIGLALLSGCRSAPSVGDAPAQAGPSASAATVPVVPPDHQKAALNPLGEKPYAGPVGTVAGVVKVTGPRAPEPPDVLAKVPTGRCVDGRAFYGKAYREGPDRELGDVLVAVTGYKDYVPPPEGPKVVTAAGCAFESRTVAMVFGQNLLVKNRGPEAILPLLENSDQVAMIVALPGGAPVQLYPTKVGHDRLSAQSHPFATADVYVLKYPTFAVTGIDGKFTIRGIPVGEVVLSAYLPITRQTVTQRVTVESGKDTALTLELPFDPAALVANTSGAGAAQGASPSGSGSPSPSP